MIKNIILMDQMDINMQSGLFKLGFTFPLAMVEGLQVSD